MIVLTKNICLFLMFFILFILVLNGINLDRNNISQIKNLQSRINRANITKNTELQNVNQNISLIVSRLKDKEKISPLGLENTQKLTDFDKKIVEDIKKQKNKDPVIIR